MKRSQTHGSAARAARHSGIPNLITCFICHNLFLNQSGLWRKPSSRGRIHTSSSRCSGSSDAAVLPRSHSHTSGSFGTFFSGGPDPDQMMPVVGRITSWRWSHNSGWVSFTAQDVCDGGPHAAVMWILLQAAELRPGLLFLHLWAAFSSNPADCTTSVLRKLQGEAK